MFTIINIIGIIISKFHARAWLWLHASTINLLPVSHLSGGRYSVVQDRFPRSGSRLFYGVLVVFSSGRGSLLSPENLSDNHPLEKLRQRDRMSITGLNEWCHQIKKKLAWNRTCWCKLQSFLNSTICVPA